MNQAETITKHRDLYERAAAVGLTLLTGPVNFEFNNVPGSQGKIFFQDLSEVERFLRGYELGYKSSLQTIK